MAEDNFVIAFWSRKIQIHLEMNQLLSYKQGISPIAKIAIAISIFIKFEIAIVISIAIAIW